MVALNMTTAQVFRSRIYVYGSSISHKIVFLEECWFICLISVITHPYTQTVTEFGISSAFRVTEKYTVKMIWYIVHAILASFFNFQFHFQPAFTFGWIPNIFKVVIYYSIASRGIFCCVFIDYILFLKLKNYIWNWVFSLVKLKETPL